MSANSDSESPRSPSKFWGFFVVSYIVLAAATTLWWSTGEEKWLELPTRHGDDVFFENIAFQVWRGNGIAVNFADSEWRAPYVAENTDGKYDWFLAWEHRGPTTSRAPGFPAFAGGVYALVGRNIVAVRLAAATVALFGLAFLMATIRVHCGLLVAVMAMATISCDLFILRALPQFMSEGLGIGLMSLLIGLCIIGQESWRKRDGLHLIYPIAIGVIFSVAMLVRSNLNAWLILLVFGGGAFGAVHSLRDRKIPNWTLGAALFLGSVIIVSSFWWSRNCIISRGFTPFGTAGSFGLAGGYCDGAYDNFGNWCMDTAVATQTDASRVAGFASLSLAEQERVQGEHSASVAKQWMQQNPQKLIPLAGMRIISHLGFYQRNSVLLIVNGLLLFGAVLGIWWQRHSIGWWILLCVGLSVVTTALTWSHFGRYSLPIRPLVHVACAIGTMCFWTFVFQLTKSRDP